ncbi:single-stranded-DNA-specific exonuclease RecJ [Thermoanaerobacterium thermosaccharolyticum]|uniref:single-stranded-DNA-specific exonuclease RecJ n=1 Tax=Thermoanaerobacterium thermosaccharolyticum TaxID=1517 RepID=UPI00123B834C|nr:single-stranded-DNA-specific exonuclease RecJ [Thermoanaerobacterium thermosaccharolyticum]KAA5807125.1 single-stranded-DNA-specific exonuclease RecJ [Thermoanaerobacterium thermosaccharolyticum]
MAYNWVSKKILNENLVEKIKIKYKLKEYIAQTIVNRGYDDLKKVDEYLNPDLNMMHSPFLLDGIEKASSVIKYHIEKNNKITIYGDYDVDGITGTSILYKTLKKLGADVNFYIPDRLQEGYGINLNAIEKIYNLGSSLIITVDCGITSVIEVEHAKKLGIEIIVTDHHQVPDVLPDATCVINPHIKNCTYPYKELSGVGVAFKLCLALIGDDALDYLDIVALGTVADIVPLTGENRIIVKEGLKMMKNSKNKGLKALINVSGLNNKDINTYHVGFVLAPRLNAAGRLESAVSCVNLLTTDDDIEANRIAEYLNSENIKRQELEKKMLDEAIVQVETKIDLDKEKFIVLYSEDWHPGIIGIVSSRITEKYNRPSILISICGDTGKGSGRSIKGFNIYDAIKYAGDCLIGFGGHEMAAGITIKKDEIESFKDKLNEYAESKLNDIDLIPTIEIETCIENETIDLEGANQLSLLEPFGNSNPMPAYIINHLHVKQTYTVGNNKHLRIIAQKNDMCYDIILFHMGSEANKFKEGYIIDIAGYINVNEWNGDKKVEIIAKDIKIKEKNTIFFRNLLNNIMNFNDFTAESLDNKNFIDMRGIQDRQSYILKMFRSNESVAVIVNTRYHLNKLINYLIVHDYRDFKLSSKAVNVEKMILWNSNYKDVDYLQSIFKNIIFYDIPFDSKMFYNILANDKNSKIHLLYGKEDIKANLKDIFEIIPRRSDFAKVYINIKKSGSTIVFKDQVYDYFKLNSVKVMLCLKILKNFGLIKIKESDNIFVLRRNNIESKVDIKDDEIIKKLVLSGKNFLKFAFQILKTKIKEETA